MTTTTKKPAMDLDSYWHEIGTENMLLVIKHVGSSIDQFRRIKYRMSGVSAAMAQRIIAAANDITPGTVPDFEALMTMRTSPAKPPRQRKGVAIPPSPAFMKAVKRRAERSTQ